VRSLQRVRLIAYGYYLHTRFGTPRASATLGEKAEEEDEEEEEEVEEEKEVEEDE
jgi:hypothetical protein